MTAWTIVVFSALVTTALLNFAKDILPGRYWFHRWWICSWLLEGVVGVERHRRFWSLPLYPRPLWKRLDRFAPNGATPEDTLLTLATGGNPGALYRVPTDQMAALLSTVTEVLLDFPARYPMLVRAFSGETLERSAATLDGPSLNTDPLSELMITAMKRELTPSEDIEMLLLLKGGFREHFVAARESQNPAGQLSGVTGSHRSGILTDVRTRVTQRMNRRLDALQIQTKTWWRVYMQMGALLLGIITAAAFSGITLSAEDFSSAMARRDWLASVSNAVLLGAAAGVLAPICDDVISVIRRAARTSS